MCKIGMSSIARVIESHKRFLETNHKEHLRPYCNRLKHQPESARAEAIACCFFRVKCDDVEVEEDLAEGKGGVDFRCNSKDGTEFVSEVTCLGTESAASQSTLIDEFPQDGFGGPFTMITPSLLRRVVSKTDQMSGYCCPRILVITCEHWMSDVLVGQAGAELLLTSEPEIVEEAIDGPGYTGNKKDIDSVTDLQHSVFFRLRNGILESCRRSISAILLFSISPDKTSSNVVGLLHPDPAHKFTTWPFPSVPFLRVKNWPLVNNKIEKEWAILEPKPDKFYHLGVSYPQS